MDLRHRISLPVVRREWARACDTVGVKAHSVGFVSESHVELKATRDGRCGTAAQIDAIHLLQPGRHHLLLGIAEKLLKAMNDVNHQMTGRHIISTGERERIGAGEFSTETGSQ